MAPAFLQSGKQTKHDKSKNTDLLARSQTVTIKAIKTMMQQILLWINLRFDSFDQ